jgi:hypothetical protein
MPQQLQAEQQEVLPQELRLRRSWEVILVKVHYMELLAEWYPVH